MLAGFDCHCMQLRWCHHNILTCRNVEMSYFDSRSLLAAKFPWGFSPAAPVRDRVRRDDVLGLLGPQLSAHSAHSALMNNYKPAQSMDVLKSCKIMQNQSTRKHDENMMKTCYMAPYGSILLLPYAKPPCTLEVATKVFNCVWTWPVESSRLRQFVNQMMPWPCRPCHWISNLFKSCMHLHPVWVMLWFPLSSQGS